jgi:negative regulator of sigma-B (phosphoserine phosphatase)
MKPYPGATAADLEQPEMRVSYVSLPKVGEIANGDAPLCRTDEHRNIMLALVDSLGHGPEAAKVTKNAIERLGAVSLQSPLLQIMEDLHLQLRGSRGAAATVCLIRNGKISACGVGNVEIRSAETAMPFVFSPGILGARVQKFRVCEAELRPGTRLVLFSDGISTRLRLDLVRSLSPKEACAAIIEKSRKAEDDATVLVADIGVTQ